MDFSNAGATQPLGGGVFRAHIQWKEKGAKREIQGPRRPDEEAAQQDLERIRKAASGMRREEGFAAIINSKSYGCPRKMGDPGPRWVPVMSRPCKCTHLQPFFLALYLSAPSYRYTLPKKLLIHTPFRQRT